MVWGVGCGVKGVGRRRGWGVGYGGWGVLQGFGRRV